jgi:acyl-CoA thioester hydrolase
MTEPFVQDYRARWSDMDWNQHMRNAAFLGCAEETRMRFLEARGWTMAEFERRRIGPVVVEDRIAYRRELKLLEPFRVDLWLARASADLRTMKVRNHFLHGADGELCATVESVVLWFDLAARKRVAPPPELASVWLTLPRTEDFSDLAVGGRAAP